MKKAIAFFIVIFMIIAIAHIMHNVEIIIKPPSNGWSRDILIQETLFNRRPLVSITEEAKILFVSPYEKGEGELKISLLDSKLEIIKEELINVDQLNFNVISPEEIFVDKNRIYWRDSSESKGYLGEFSNDYQKIEIINILENIDYLNQINHNNISYVTTKDSDGRIFITMLGSGEEKIIEGPKGIENIVSTKLAVDGNQMYLLIEQRDSITGFKNILISMGSNGEWTVPQKVNEINETRVSIKSTDIVSDGDNVYSVLVIQGDDKSRFTYFVDGLNLKTHEPFETITLEHGSNSKIGYFSSIPMIIGPLDSGFEIVTTAPTNIDLYSRNASNVIKLSIDKEGIQREELLSKTKSWSNRPYYVLNDNEYVFWNEPEKGSHNTVRAATTEKSVVEKSIEKNSHVIKEAVGEEVPVITSYNLLYSIGGRLISLLPALFWLLFMFVKNERLSKKWNQLFLVGIAIFYVFQLITMNDIYYPNTLMYMPGFLKIKGAKIIYPTIFTFVGWCGARLWGKEKETKEGYKLYMTFIVFSYLLMNYLYSPYVFK